MEQLNPVEIKICLNNLIETKNFKGIRYCLCQLKHDPNKFCERLNEYPLHTAVRLGNLDAVKLLLCHGANIEATVFENDIDFTPVCFAIVHNRLPIVKYFLENGYSIESNESLVSNAFVSGSKRMLHFFAKREPATFALFAHMCIHLPLLSAVGELVELPVLPRMKRGTFVKYVKFFYYCINFFPKPSTVEILHQVSKQLVGLAFVSGQFEIALKIISCGYNCLQLEDLCFYANLFPGFSCVLKTLNPKLVNVNNFIANYCLSPAVKLQLSVLGSDELEEFVFWLQNQQNQPLPLLDHCKQVCRKFKNIDTLPTTLIEYLKIPLSVCD